MAKSDSRRPRGLLLAIQLALGGVFVSLTPQAIAADVEETVAAKSAPQSPDALLGPLFNAVQSAKLFPDQKTFADAIPRSDPLMILADYHMQRNQSGFDLRHFVKVNFVLPKEGEKYVPSAEQSLREHIDSLWPVLTRTGNSSGEWDSLLTLPRPYVVPGGRFREVYYWDSYFTMLGLAESGNWDKVRDMVDNFAYEIDTWGHIPNGNRSYYLSRSQPPFFAMMVELLASHDNGEALTRYLPQMKKEYQYWMAGSDTLAVGDAKARVVKLRDGTLLNRYWDDKDTPRPESWLDDVTTAKSDPNRKAAQIYRDLRAAAASGWDFSSRWMDDPQKLSSTRTTSIAPVDLNALMFHLEKTLARASKAAGDVEGAERYTALASQRQRAIEKYMWNNERGWYADYDLQHHRVRSQLTAAALFPLYVQASSKERAAKVAEGVRHHLLKEGGLLTTEVNSGQQWDAPNGWAPLQWVAIEGLNHYGQNELAGDIRWRFLSSVQRIYSAERKLVEKYDVTGQGAGGGGEYPLQDGFGWTNGVTLKLLDELCGADIPCDNVPPQRPGYTAPNVAANPQPTEKINAPQPAEQ
ncbi:alpha,alpha-trehalase TreA [Erwinia sp. CPCC 100877]|nr:alpha,alpha-trehalase TreA [Erwinia sp. CPCC 100877]